MHLNNDTLELLALKAEFSPTELKRLQKHLDSCLHCRERYEEIREFYRAVEKDYLELKEKKLDWTHSTGALQRNRTQVPTPFEHFVTLRPRPDGFLGRVGTLLTSHPLMTGLGGAVAVGAIGLGLLSLFRFNATVNPAYVSLNPARLSMEAYDTNDKLIWNTPVWCTEADIRRAKDLGESGSQVVDIDNDGKHEVVTTYKLARDGGQPLSAVVTVFNADGSLRAQHRLGRSLTYDGRQYDTTYNTQGLMVIPGASGEETQILVCLQNRRSPCALVRLDGELNELGAYWHYGHLHGPGELALNDGRRAVLLWGVDDAADDKGLPRSTLVVLDPSKISGVRQSSATPGFGYMTSDAEIFVLRFPDPDFVGTGEVTSSVRRIEAITERSLHVIQSFETSRGETLPGLEYILHRNLSVAKVRPISGYEAVHHQLVHGGATSATLGARYFDALASGVKYWDGTSWVGHNTMVQGAVIAQDSLNDRVRPSQW